jgi:flagellar biosynthetic protein FliQ
MNELEVIELGRDAILTLLKISAPIMGMALVVGLIIALFQALTSIQEMTLTFVPKILVVIVSVMLFLPYMLSTLSGFTVSLFDRMLSLG